MQAPLTSDLLKSNFPQKTVGPEAFCTEFRLRHLQVNKREAIAFESVYRISSRQEQSWMLNLALLDTTDLLRRNQVLGNALRNAIKMFRLSDEYASLLQERVSAEDYDSAMDAYKEFAMSYVRVPRDVPAREIAYEAKTVLDVLDEDMTSDELADILNLDAMAVENALTAYSKRKVDVA